MTTTGPCEISSPSSKFFGARSEFLDIPLFRPSLFTEDDSGPGGAIPPSSQPRSPLSWKCSTVLLVTFHAT